MSLYATTYPKPKPKEKVLTEPATDMTQPVAKIQPKMSLRASNFLRLVMPKFHINGPLPPVDSATRKRFEEWAA